jgi:hypothetical protein
MIQLAWLWLRHQPGSALNRWFQERVGDKRGKIKRIAIVAVARTQGVVPEGPELKAWADGRINLSADRSFDRSAGSRWVAIVDSRG